MCSYHEGKPPEQCSKPWNCTVFWVQGRHLGHAQVRIAWSTNDSKRVDGFASTKMMSANMLHPGCRTPWKYWDELHINWFLRIVSPQGCRITVHPRYEEADTFIWKMLRRWTTPPGNYANVGYQQVSGWDGNSLTLHHGYWTIQTARFVPVSLFCSYHCHSKGCETDELLWFCGTKLFIQFQYSHLCMEKY